MNDTPKSIQQDFFPASKRVNKKALFIFKHGKSVLCGYYLLRGNPHSNIDGFLILQT